MSRFITPLRIAMAAILLCLAAARPATAQDYNSGDASYQQFYDDLSPYGEWIDDPDNGYVWVPDAGDDFRPYYTNGYWANTDYGNTWVSDYDWGWAPFHYGRWTYNNYYGWVWIPGNEWGPAWVSWRSGGGSYGWAPLGPGISISASFGNGYYTPDYWWIFTPQQDILNQRFHQYCYGPRYNNQYIRQTTVINNTYVHNHSTYIAGPRRADLERATGRPVQAIAISDSRRPDRSQIHGNSLSIYRPAIANARPRPTERPRQFRAAGQPIGAAPHEIATPVDRNITRQPVRDRGQVIQQQNTNPQVDRPVRSGNQGAIQQHQPIERAPVQQADRQLARPTEMQQPQRSRNDWGSGNRMPDRSPAQQPQQQADRLPVNRNRETPRMQQAQPTQQPQRIERPVMEPRQQPVQQQRVEAPRMEAPRAAPQREAPAAQPAHNDRPQNGGEGNRIMRH